MLRSSSTNIETLRVIATFSLVAYHAIGVTELNALNVSYPHPLRFFADLLIDFRMPIFGFIAGWVYGLRPVTNDKLSAYVLGKVRRLLIPGILASLIYFIIGTFIIPDSIAAHASIWNVISLSFIHFWFLNSIFILLIAIGLVEGLTNRSLHPLVMMGLIGAAFLSPYVEIPFLEIEGAKYLAPFFLLGVIVNRNSDFFHQHRGSLLSIAIVAVIAGLTINVMHYQARGQLSLDRRDLQSILTGIGIIIVFFLILPRFSILTAFGPASFTIYLYHVLGTSGARRTCEVMGLENTWAIFIIAFLSGILLPFLVHRVLSLYPITRLLFLGTRAPNVKSRTTQNAVKP